MPARLGGARLLAVASVGLPLAVLVLGVIPAPRGGLTLEFLLSYGGLLAALVVTDQALARLPQPRWRGLALLGVELALCTAVVMVHGTLIRPAFAYLVPASRALMLLPGAAGLGASLAVWPAYALAIAAQLPADRWHEFPNYLSFFLGLYVPTAVLTLATARSAQERLLLQSLYDELQRSHLELQELHRQARDLAVTQERNRLAREIHDTLAHYLTVTNLQLEAAEKLAATAPDRALEQVQRARRLVLTCLQDVRHSVQALRASDLRELSLDVALRRLTAEFAEASGLAVSLRAEDLPDQLPPEVALALYRAAQEGLTNVQKHAAASSVRLDALWEDGGLAVVVIDNGMGPRSSPAHDDGFGLVGLRERLALLDGRLSFAVAPEGGSRLRAWVPLPGEGTA